MQRLLLRDRQPGPNGSIEYRGLRDPLSARWRIHSKRSRSMIEFFLDRDLAQLVCLANTRRDLPKVEFLRKTAVRLAERYEEQYDAMVRNIVAGGRNPARGGP